MPPAVVGQQRPRRIGVLLAAYTPADPAGQARVTTFVNALQSLGWNDDRNVRLVYRGGHGNPEHIELVINHKTAKAHGLTAPATLLARADAVIE